MNNYKIAVIGLKGLPSQGGAAYVGENIIYNLNPKIYSFTVLSVDSHTIAASGYLKKNIYQKVFSGFGKSGLNTFIYYIRCLIHVILNNYDLIHIHHAESGFITPILRLRYRVICTLHGVFRDSDPKFSKFHNSFFRFSERLNIIFANKVISVSEPDKNYILKKYNRNIIYIPNGINILNLDFSSADKNKESYISFAAGRIYEIKGLDLLINACKLSNFNKKIKVAGDLDQVNSYKKKIIKISKDINIDFLGMITKKEKLYRFISGSDFFVFPSLTEAMSIMLLEVASLKVPMIVSDIPSNKAVFDEDEVLFFKTGDEIDLSKKIIYANDNPDKMQYYAKNAYDKLFDNHLWKNIANKYDKIIRG